MSWQATTWALGRAPSIASQAILFALANYADEWGITYVGQEKLASDCACRQATVSANLAKLEECGLIKRVGRRDARGRRTSDHVILAPLASDRGGMLDADKRAREKHPASVCDVARRYTPSVYRDTSLNTPNGEPIYATRIGLYTPSVYEPSEEPLEEPPVRERARAREGQALLGVSESQVDAGFEWWAADIARRTRRRPRKTKAALAAMRKILEMEEGNSVVIKRRYEWAVAAGRFWAGQAADLSRLASRWGQLVMEMDADERRAAEIEGYRAARNPADRPWEFKERRFD